LPVEGMVRMRHRDRFRFRKFLGYWGSVL
jgi:hypothetical protein